MLMSKNKYRMYTKYDIWWYVCSNDESWYYWALKYMNINRCCLYVVHLWFSKRYNTRSVTHSFSQRVDITIKPHRAFISHRNLTLLNSKLITHKDDLAHTLQYHRRLRLHKLQSEDQYLFYPLSFETYNISTNVTWSVA